MKELVVVSGKGGTGKTTITASFTYLAKNKVIADCDVDASDMHLITAPDILNTIPFKGRKKAVVNEDKCISCGKCEPACHFDAISDINKINPIKCEGCGVCDLVCPVDAIDMVETIAGDLHISESRYGPMIHARLRIGEENSGQLVTLVRQYAKIMSADRKKELIIIDGPPGTACPTTSAVTGTNLAVVVTEPTLSGLHDLKRVTDVIKHFRVEPVVIVNKYDINKNMTDKIQEYCNEKNIPLLGKIPFDKVVVEAMVAGKSIPEYYNGELTIIIKEIWEKVYKLLTEVN